MLSVHNVIKLKINRMIAGNSQNICRLDSTLLSNTSAIRNLKMNKDIF